MTYDEYQQEALTFLNPELPRGCVELDTVLGIGGEFSEVVEAIMAKPVSHSTPDCVNELGDMLWYLAVGLHGQRCKLHDTVNRIAPTGFVFAHETLGTVLLDFIMYHGKLSDMMKKHWFQHHSLNPVDVRDTYNELLYVWFKLMYVCDPSITPMQVMEANIKKLRTRYPNGFTREASIARVDEAKGK